jgi:poly-D-alanine transfer protein DltD
LNKNKTIWNILNIPLHCLKLKTFSTITRTNYKNEGDSYRRRFHSNNSTTCLTGISNFSTTANHADITWKNKTEDNDEHNQDSKNKESSTATNENNEMSVNNKYYYLIKQKYTATRHQKYKPNLLDGTAKTKVGTYSFSCSLLRAISFA